MNRLWFKALGLLGLFGFMVGAAVFLLDRVGTSVIPQDRYVVQADVRDAVALAGAADVRQGGVRIGRVGEIREVGTLIQLKLELDEEHAPVYRDATTLVRAKSIAEENYVELDPGTPEAGEIPEGGRIPVSNNLEATQNDDVFSIFDRPRRQDVRSGLRSLAAGLDGKGSRNLNRSIESLTALTDDAAPFAEVLAQERGHVARLIDSFGTVTRALGEREEAVRRLTRSSKTAAEAVAARDEQLRATIKALRPFLDRGRRTAARLGSFSTSATPVLADLRVALDTLVPVAQDLGPAAVAGRRAVASLRRFSRAATPALRELSPFSAQLAAFSPAYGSFLRELNPLTRYLRPYLREIPGWFALAGAATRTEDTVGNVARVLIPASSNSVAGSLPQPVREGIDAARPTNGSNPYPKPGQADKPVQKSGDYPRLEADPPSR